jgi:Tfp pilus assembly protein FimT
MIVLAVLATLTAISLPMLTRPLNKSRLQDGAQQLSKALADLRIVAMQEGRPYLFRYQMGASGFQSCPAELFLAAPDQLDTETDTTTLDVNTTSTDTVDMASDDLGYDGEGQLQAAPDTVDMQSLPNGVTFADAILDTVDSRLDEQAVIDRQLVEVPDPYPEPSEDVSFDSANWSTPVLFYPDGRATSVQLTLISDDGYEVDVSVRGLTGAVRAGGLRRTPGTVVEGTLDEGLVAEGDAWEEEEIPEQPTP